MKYGAVETYIYSLMPVLKKVSSYTTDTDEKIVFYYPLLNFLFCFQNVPFGFQEIFFLSLGGSIHFPSNEIDCCLAFFEDLDLP